MADRITHIRILCSFIMLFFKITSVPFFILYLLCGLSDVADGIVARKTNSETALGARLDTAADFMFSAVVMIKILWAFEVSICLWVWIIAIAGIKIGNIILGFVRKKRFMAEHTLLNKVTGVLFFLLPLTVFFVELKYSTVVVCTAATISAIHEGYYIINGREVF